MLTLLIICFIVAVHEFGHFLFAKLFGVGVKRFSIGFGPVLLAKKFGETEYVLSAVPLGGYVSMVGEENGKENHSPKSYNSKPRWKRIIILLAGPGFNFLFGFLLILSSFTLLGIPNITNRITSIQDNSPAFAAGLKPNDKIVGINGNEIKLWQDIIANISSASPEKEIELKIERNNAGQLNVRVKPDLIDGKPRIGIAGGEVVSVRHDLGKSIRASVDFSIFQIKLIASGFYQMISGQIPLRDSLGGPIAIMDIGNQAKSQNGWAGILLFAAFINFNLGILNLLPIPVLDGGNIMILLVESVIRRPLNKKLRGAVQMIGLVLILAIMIFAVSNDLSRLFSK